MTKRERIFYAGAKLFAEKTYDSVGIRDIAREADANSAMISYYFKGKLGLLREIFSCFATTMIATLERALTASSTQNELVENTVLNLLAMANENRDLVLVGLRELNKETEDLQDLRDKMRDDGWEIYAKHLDRLSISANKTDDVPDISFTALLGLVFSDYLLGGNVLIDSEEYRGTYTRTIVKILQKGMPATWN